MAHQFIEEAEHGRVVGRWHAWWYGVRHGLDWNTEARIVLLFTTVVGGVALVSSWPMLFATGTAYIGVSVLSRAVGAGISGLMAHAEMMEWLRAHPHQAEYFGVQPQFVGA